MYYTYDVMGILMERHIYSFSGCILNNAILWQIAENMGLEWRQFGIHLNFKSAYLEQLEYKHDRDIPSMVFKLLKDFKHINLSESETDTRQRLCTALDKCKRRDLVEMLDNMELGNKPRTPTDEVDSKNANMPMYSYARQIHRFPSDSSNKDTVLF